MTRTRFSGVLGLAVTLTALFCGAINGMAQTPLSTKSIERMALTARAVGMPPDQLKSFVSRGYVPQPKQMEFHAAARLCDAPDGPTRIGFGGARGPGKSHACLSQAALDDCQRFPGLKVLYLRMVGGAASEAVEDQRRTVLRLTPHAFMAKGQGIVLFPNGSKIILGHFQHEKDINKYIGLEYDLIIVEEATTLSQAKVRSILSCLRTSKRGWRCRAYFTTNPGNIGHLWFKQMFIMPYRKGQEKRTRFVPATVYDNQFVDREYRETLEDFTGWQRKAWLDGDWDVAAGQYFVNWNHDTHVVPVAEMPKLGADWTILGGFDYGLVHYTSSHLLAKDGDGTVWVFDEYAQRGKLPETNADGIIAMCERHGLQAPAIRFYAGSDVFSKRHNNATIAKEYKEKDINLVQANLDRINGAAEFSRRLGDAEVGIKPTLFVSERCARLIECIPALMHDDHRPEDVKKVDCDADGLGGDDPYDDTRYALMALRGKRRISVI